MEMFRRIAVVVSAFGLVSNAVALVEPSRPALTNIESRQKEITWPAPAEKRHAAAKLSERIPQVQIEFEEITGSPKRISTTRGLLTGPNGIGRAVSEDSIRGFGINDPHRVTKAFLKEHKLLFGYGPEVLEKAHVKREHTARHNELRTVVWEQQLDGIAVFEAVLMSHTTRQGELVSISSQLVPDVTSAANKGHRNKARQRNEPTLSVANLLSAGTHTAEIVFTDQSNGRSQTNAVTLRIGEMDFLTEWFDLRDNDLGYQSITFTPDGSPAFYSVCRAPATNFPVNPSGSIPFATNAWSNYRAK